MKLTFSQDDDTEEQASGIRPSSQAAQPPTKRKRASGLSRARKQLSQAVGGVLSNSLGALQGLRPQSRSAAAPPTIPSALHGLRLREVIERDRALAASEPLPTEVAAPRGEPALEPTGEPAVEPTGESAVEPTGESAVEPFEEQDLDLQTKEFQIVARAPEVLLPRSDAIARAIEEAIFDARADDTSDEIDVDLESLREPPEKAIQLEPLVAASAKPVTIKGAAAGKPVIVCKEPIRTRTMAKLLASQGHRARALSIYDFLIAKSPHDEALTAEAEALRSVQD
jgi:hypothetical protein